MDKMNLGEVDDEGALREIETYCNHNDSIMQLNGYELWLIYFAVVKDLEKTLMFVFERAIFPYAYSKCSICNLDKENLRLFFAIQNT